jgi:glutamate-5-semialdehyde dehydrogenase
MLLMVSVKSTAIRSKKSTSLLAGLATEVKNKALRAMVGALLASQEAILKENAKDVMAAQKKGISSSLVKRLTLDKAKIKSMADSLKLIASLKDPVGSILTESIRPNGLSIKKVRVPIGVILIIYESRPNVTVDCMALCLKSGNSVILKGGSEAIRSNTILFNVLSRAAITQGVPAGAFEFVTSTDRADTTRLLGLDEMIDLVIPRGGEGLIREVSRISKIPVIKHAKGVCHVYVDKDADLAKAEKIIMNAKTQNPSVCNAMESLLVHEGIAKRFLPNMVAALIRHGVEVRGCQKTKAIVPQVKKASADDWGREYLDLVLSSRVVKDLKEAIAHIGRYGSHHSDSIVTENKASALEFTNFVDSSAVFVNCSTRFNDGGEFGMGAEMGISTGKLHARGPMGLEELTSYKYVVVGDGQIRV